MRRRATILVACLLALACLAAPAAAAPADSASAHAGLRAYRAYLSSALRKADAAGRGDDAFIAAIAGKCPGVLTSINTLPPDAYDQSVLVSFGKEVGADLVVSAFASYQSTLATLAHRVARLHWSSAATRVRIQRSLDAQRALFELAPSDLCADASVLAADAKTTPPGTAAFAAAFNRDVRAAGLTAFTRTLARYAPASDRKLARSLDRLTKRVDGKLGGIVDAKVRKLLGVVGLRI